MTQNKTADYLEWSDMKRMVNDLIKRGKPKIALFIAVSSYCGTRYSDTIRLTWIQLSGDTIRLLEKKTENTRRHKKIREITISNELRDIIDLCKPERVVNEDGLIFTNSDGKALSIQSLNQYCKRLRKRYKLSIEHFSLHSLRKSMGRRFYEVSGRTEHSLMLLSSMFGHSSPEITRIYLGLKREEIAEAYRSL